jgi:tetratricopeptide (TPR) repeat protein
MYLLLAIGHNKLKNTEKALHYLTVAISKYERFLEAYCYRAKIYTTMKKYQKAEEDFDAALNIDSEKQVAVVGKADCLRSRGLYK